MADGIRRRGADLSTSGGGAWAPPDSGSTSTSSTFASYSDMATVDVRDRTSEFREACRAAKAKRTTPAPPTPARQRSAFTSDAAAIGREIKSTAEKLERLSKLAKRRALFDDPAEEINEMTAIIKQSITHLSTEVTDLKARASTDGGTNQQSKQHSTGVINSLQQTLKNTTSEFMDVVKTRRQAVQDQQDTLSVYGASSKPLKSSVFAPAPPAGGAQTEREGPSYSSGGLGDTFESQSQLVAMQPQDYLQSRADDVEQVESTIRELGGIFGRLAEIVSEQGEMVERIDSNVEEMDSNVQGAQAELLKYLNSISSNRALIAKIFAVMMFFAAVWVVFFV